MQSQRIRFSVSARIVWSSADNENLEATRRRRPKQDALRRHCSMRSQYNILHFVVGCARANACARAINWWVWQRLFDCCNRCNHRWTYCGCCLGHLGILQAIFIAKANDVFVAAAGPTALKKLRGVHLGLNIATLVPLTGFFVFVSVPITLVKRANKLVDGFGKVRALGLASIAIHIFMYVLIGILSGTTIVGDFSPSPSLATLFPLVFVIFFIWIAVHVAFTIVADRFILTLIDQEAALAPKTPLTVIAAGDETEFESARAD